jgi:hypothetical protein
MTEHLKTYQLDGLPGLTFPGIKGNVGERGLRTYTNYYSPLSSNQYGIYDLWLSNTISAEPYISSIYNCNVGEIPISNDYLLYSQSGSIYLYKIEYYVRRGDLSSKQFIDDNINNILDYYTNHSNDLCIATLIDTWAQVESNISIVANTKNIAYEAWNGETKIVNGDLYAVKTNATSPFIYFDVISTVGNNLGKIKVTAEFNKDSTNYGEMGSELQKMWYDIPTSSDPSNYIYGYPDNYNYTLNYDNEELGNFEIIIKDWSDAVNQTSYSSPSYIKKETLNDYIISLYVYTNISNFINKTYIGEFTVNDLL